MNDVVGLTSGQTNRQFFQMGYFRHRFEGQPIKTEIYFEFKIPPVPAPILITYDDTEAAYRPPPIDGSPHVYATEWKEVGDTIFAKYDGIQFYGLQGGTGWQISTGKYAIWSAEISGSNSDMFGSLLSPCHFRACQYELYNSMNYLGAQFSQSDTIGTTDPNGTQWGIDFQVGTNHVWMWDNFRLP